MPTDTAGTLVPVASHIFITAQGIYLILSIPLRPTMVRRYFASLSDELPKGFDNLIWRKIPLVYGNECDLQSTYTYVVPSSSQLQGLGIRPIALLKTNIVSVHIQAYHEFDETFLIYDKKWLKFTDFQPADWQRRKAIVTDREGLWVRELSSVGAKTGF